MSIAEIFASMEYGPAPESDEAARAWLKTHDGAFGLFIDGAWVEPAAGERFETVNPATGETLARIAQAGADDIDAAVAAARKAQPRWNRLGGHGRARHLYALARLVQKHARLFAVLESMDNGKPVRESRDIDLPLVARHFYHHAGWAQLMDSELKGYGPLGVAGQIIPWNFPLLMLAWKVAPALATGNAVVLKPAEFTSLTALLFADLCREAGLPKGVVNIVTGDGRAGELVARHGGIDKIAFTGSTEVGRLVREATAGSGKSLTLELGGKSPFIVFDDADFDSAVEGLVDAIWFNQGEVCCAGSRLLVQEGVAEAFLARLHARMQTLRVGDSLDKSVDIGAIVAPVQRQRILTLVERGVAEGAELWQPDIPVPEQGCFVTPTLLTGVAPASVVAQEEIFGPVLVSMTFRTPAEAVALANNTRYGLAASVWSDNISLALDIAAQLRCGVVWVNATNLFDAASGFGGCRESGFGREGGLEGVFEYLRPDHAKSYRSYAAPRHPRDSGSVSPAVAPVDRTAKMYIGGRQVRPDGGNSLPVLDPKGRLIAHVGDGNRKDIRNAVEAARAAGSWGRTNGHLRAQILFYVAENLAAREAEFAARITAMTGSDGAAEVAASIRRLFSYAAWADKYDGAVHGVPLRGVAMAMREPVGIIGVCCGDRVPLLGLVSLVAPAIAMGNRVVAIPSEIHPLAATDLYQVLDTSDLPAGVLNIVTGARDALSRTLAEHDEVDAVWYVGPAAGGAAVERAAAGNLKRVWNNNGLERDWFDPDQGEGAEFLRHATHIKNVWIPYGE
ncbi:MAG: aldehyde dehydrogenase family protein [Rhodospirillales bacterium]|nr:MAG: aldehyde dehydrogenase family protein [Rhodospirillales bacterium]